MDRKSYVDRISDIENEQTKNVIGKIDKEILNSEIIESLYYIFPLVERMILEIYKLIPDADVEHYEQGIMKTPIAIIENNKTNLLPEDIVTLIKKYYGDDGLRNELLHIQKEIFEVSVSFDELTYLIANLLSILKELLKENSSNNFDDIELLK